MKKLIAIAAMVFMGVAIAPKAEAKINIQINIGNQPAWGPTGYDYAQFYYFPDYNFYYDISRGQYVVLNRNTWVYTQTIPAAYRFNPYNAYKVVLNQNAPYRYNSTHIRTYAQYKGMGGRQMMIRDSRENKYYASKGHPMHSQWQKNNNNGRGNAYNKRDEGRNTAYNNGNGRTTGGVRR